MRTTPHSAKLQEFIAEIEQLALPALAGTHQWRLCDDIQNAVEIGYPVNSPSDRKILHHIGQRYGLIPLCPGELVDIARDGSSMIAFVTTAFGPLRIGPSRLPKTSGSKKSGMPPRERQ